MKNKIKVITTKEVKEISHFLAQSNLEWDEPIPNFDMHNKHILESCLATPFQSFLKKDIYSNLFDKGAVLFYLMIKNHPFYNGNKRIALVTLLVFLFKNNKWLTVDNTEIYNLAKWVAASNPKLREETILAIKKFIKTYTVPLSSTKNKKIKDKF